MSGEFAQPGIDSPVNEHRWPVPLPRGVTLEAVRNELLNLEVGPGEVGAEYVWLDVVCLRQHGDSRNEKVRLMEWRIDVPMIGRIYSHALRVVRYYNGLGVAFQAFGWNNERHWLRRAWTVQEISTRTIQAGLPLSIANPLDVVCMDDPYNRRPLRDRLRSVMRLEHAIETGFSALQDILLLIQEMRPRQATRPVDKIVALCSLLRLTQIPMYSEDMDLEDVWALHIKYMPIRLQTAFLWLFDRTGLGKYKWRPSWEQLMTGGFAIVKHWKIPDDNFNMQATDDGSVSSPVQVFDGWARLQWSWTSTPSSQWLAQCQVMYQFTGQFTGQPNYLPIDIPSDSTYQATLNNNVTVKLVGSPKDGGFPPEFVMVCEVVQQLGPSQWKFKKITGGAVFI